MKSFGVLASFVVVVQSCAASELNAAAQMVAMSARTTSATSGHDKLRIIATQDKMSRHKPGQVQSAASADLKMSLQKVIDEHLSKNGVQSQINLRGGDLSASVEPTQKPGKVQSEVTMHDRVGVAVVSVPADVDDAALQNMISAMMAVENIKTVESDIYITLEDYTTQAPPNPIQGSDNTTDPYSEFLWGMQHIGASVAHSEADLPIGYHKPRVVIIDTGIRTDHPDLKDNIFVNCAEMYGEPGVDDDENGYIDDVHGWNSLNSTADMYDDNGHGTHVAGTIGAVANNGIGVYGVHNKAKIVGCKFLDAKGGGYIADAVACIDYSIAVESYITNNSYGGSGTAEFFRVAIERARDFGQLFVSSAGNTAGPPTYPAAYSAVLDNVLSVASIDQNDSKSSFSCYDPEIVNIAAPGGSIVSTCGDNSEASYCTLSGTSMASPHVAGSAALLKSMRPTWTYQQIRDAIQEGAQPFVDWESYTKWGCLNLAATVDRVLHGPNLETTSTTTATTVAKCNA